MPDCDSPPTHNDVDLYWTARHLLPEHRLKVLAEYGRKLPRAEAAYAAHQVCQATANAELDVAIRARRA